MQGLSAMSGTRPLRTRVLFRGLGGALKCLKPRFLFKRASRAPRVTPRREPVGRRGSVPHFTAKDRPSCGDSSQRRNLTRPCRKVGHPTFETTSAVLRVEWCFKLFKGCTSVELVGDP